MPRPEPPRGLPLQRTGTLYRDAPRQFMYNQEDDWYLWCEIYTTNPEYSYIHKRAWYKIFPTDPNTMWLIYDESSPLEFLLITGHDFYSSLQDVYFDSEQVKWRSRPI